MCERDAAELYDATLELYEKSFFEAFRSLELGQYMNHHFATSMALPAAKSALEVQSSLWDLTLQTLRGERDPMSVGAEAFARMCSGARYESLVQTYGRQLFGSARREGERRLGEDAVFTLTYFPPKPGVEQGPAVFHLGGVLPYGDRLFRMLPETCFFDRFTERGLPVYAMELKGDCHEIDYRDLTLEKLIDAVSHFSGLAFDHAEGRKMVLEGYCALASHAHAYVAARPLEANSRFAVVATFVGPVDGTKCGALADIMRVIPASVLEGAYAAAEALHDYVGGDQMRATHDVALDGMFYKTAFGRFAAGWSRPDYAKVGSVEDLTPEQRRDLAGAYWISPDNCRRFPVPVDLARYSSGLFTRGVTESGGLPAQYRGRPLSLGDAVEGTDLRFVGFYGGKDTLVPSETADVLKKLMGERYTHVVHPTAGHVSYVMSPKVWNAGAPKALEPNPVEVLIEAYGGKQAKSASSES